MFQIDPFQEELDRQCTDYDYYREAYGPGYTCPICGRFDLIDYPCDFGECLAEHMGRAALETEELENKIDDAWLNFAISRIDPFFNEDWYFRRSHTVIDVEIPF